MLLFKSRTHSQTVIWMSISQCLRRWSDAISLSLMCLCLSVRVSGWWAARGSGSPCCCVRSGLSPCELPSDPRLSMRELIMADGPRCKRRKQANPRRKNGKRAAWESVLARYAGRGEMSADRAGSSWAEIGVNARDVNKGHVALFLSVFSLKFGNESLCVILRSAKRVTVDACGFFSLTFRLFKKLLTGWLVSERYFHSLSEAWIGGVVCFCVCVQMTNTACCEFLLLLL